MAKINAWDLYKDCFKDGDSVVIITELDYLIWGKLETTKIGCYLKRRNRWGGLVKGKLWLWDEIRFMANDGFPCRQLLGADGSRAIEKECTVENVIRHAFEEEYDCTATMVLGDPFIIEDVDTILYNLGNSGDYWDELDEEVIKMTSKDGAVGCLWDLSTIFFFQKI